MTRGLMAGLLVVFMCACDDGRGAEYDYDAAIQRICAGLDTCAPGTATQTVEQCVMGTSFALEASIGTSCEASLRALIACADARAPQCTMTAGCETELAASQSCVPDAGP